MLEELEGRKGNIFGEETWAVPEQEDVQSWKDCRAAKEIFCCVGPVWVFSQGMCKSIPAASMGVLSPLQELQAWSFLARTFLFYSGALQAAGSDLLNTSAKFYAGLKAGRKEIPAMCKPA